jgi:transposase-like protein
MPWLETSLMDQRTQFIADYLRGLQTVTELAERFDVSRKTAYKWIVRYEEGAGLSDRSRRPHACPHETAQRPPPDLASADHGVRPAETP